MWCGVGKLFAGGLVWAGPVCRCGVVWCGVGKLFAGGLVWAGPVCRCGVWCGEAVCWRVSMGWASM